METSIRKKLENYLNDTTSRDEAFESLMPYAKKIASKYYGLFSEDEDILSAAYEGLISGLERIKKSKIANALFLRRSIMNSIRKEITSNLDIRYSEINRYKMVNTLIKIRRLTDLLGEELEKDEILVSEESLRSIRALESLLLEYKMERLDEKFTNYENLDTVQNGTVNPESALIYKELLEEIPSLLEKIKLTENEKYVLVYHILYGLPQRIVATKLGVNESRISQLKSRIMQKLRDANLDFQELAIFKERNDRIDVRERKERSESRMIEETERLTANYIKENFTKLYSEKREQLIKHYMPLAERIAKRYFGLGIEDEDILMSAYEGLLTALDLISDNIPSNFLDYLEHKIIASIKRELVSALGYEKVQNCKMITNTLLQIRMLSRDLGRKPSQEEILEILPSIAGINSASKVENMTERLDETFMSYEKLDSVQNGIINPESTLIYKELLEEVPSLLEKLKLTKNEKYVFIYCILYGQSPKMVATKLGVSEPRISQLNSRIMQKLRYANLDFQELALFKERSERIDVRGLTYKKRK